MGKLIVIVIAAALAVGSIGSLFMKSRHSQPGDSIVLASDGRKDDVEVELATEESEGDGDDTEGDDGTSGGANTGDGDRTAGNDGTSGGGNTGDGDGTAGNDGTDGGDNTFVQAPAPKPVRSQPAQQAPAPAPAPVDADSDDGYSDGGDT